jgi:hypothetical protein
MFYEYEIGEFINLSNVTYVYFDDEESIIKIKLNNHNIPTQDLKYPDKEAYLSACDRFELLVKPWLAQKILNEEK